MTEEIKETALIVRIEHENPIDSRALGYVLCNFSKEFDLFLMDSVDYEKYKNKNLTLSMKKIEHGSIEMYFVIICNIDALLNTNINIDILHLFFDYLIKESCSKLKKELAKFILRFKAKINFELEFLGKKIDGSFSIDDKDAEEIIASDLESELDALRYESLLIKKKQEMINETFNIITNVLCNKNDSNNLENKLNILREESLLVKEKQDILNETLDIITNAHNNDSNNSGNDSNNLERELNTLRYESLLVKEKQDILNETLDIITNVFCNKNYSNNLEIKLNALREELLLVKEKQDILNETLDIITNVSRNKNSYDNLQITFNKLSSELCSIKEKQEYLNETLCILIYSHCKKNNSTESEEVPE